ncbi:hypothetical protein [Nocardia fusca]|uniref:hypothetical protein n=1 Tax=Nocardia fusca TaxID=941183 RepID=UPI0007A75DE3|nr:hypothetical protein [Nocardia fusca]
MLSTGESGEAVFAAHSYGPSWQQIADGRTRAYSLPEREREFFTDLFPVIRWNCRRVRESVRVEFSGR